MTDASTIAPTSDREVVLTRLFDAPRGKRGIHAGWGQCADQLAALVATL